MEEFEIKEYEEQLEGQNPPSEDNKKIIILALILGLLSLSYYYWLSLPKEKPALTQKQLGLTLVKPGEKINSPKKINLDKKVIQINKVQPQTIDKKPEKKEQVSFMPMDKKLVVKAALSGTGKNDVFQEDNSSVYSENIAINPNKFKIVPPPFLKGIPNLPFVNLNGTSSAPALPVEASFSIKGFIGNKVIVYVDGISEALGAGENYKGIKVLAVDTNNSTAKFKKEGKIFYKNLSNNEISINKDVKL